MTDPYTRCATCGHSWGRNEDLKLLATMPCDKPGCKCQGATVGIFVPPPADKEVKP